MNLNEFCGVYTALVTPFFRGQIDFKALDSLLDYQIKKGANGLVCLSTASERPTLEEKEKVEILNFVIEKNAGRIPIVASTGYNSTKNTVHYTKEAHELGVDAVAVVAPYYNKPSQQGLFLHFSEIAESTDKPIFLCNMPARCGISIEIDTIVKLKKKYSHVIGIKEASGSCNRVSQLIKELGDEIIVFCGDDTLILPFLAVGAKGAISVAANFAVKSMTKMVNLALNDEFEKAAEFNKEYYPFLKTLMLEPNPVTIKHVLHKEGIIDSSAVRLPLCGLQELNAKILNQQLALIK